VGVGAALAAAAAATGPIAAAPPTTDVFFLAVSWRGRACSGRRRRRGPVLSRVLGGRLGSVGGARLL